MRIERFEQSGFIFEDDGGFRLALDIGNKSPLEKLEGVGADAMLISHIHGDHFSLEHIKKIQPKELFLNEECIETLGEESLPFKITQIKTETEIIIKNIKIKIFNVDHGPNVSAPLQENFGFLITIDGKKIYFAGDMFYSSGIDVSDLEVNFALIPVGTYYTFGPKEAFEFIKKFKKIDKIISMHYDKTPETKNEFLELTKDKFLVE